MGKLPYHHQDPDIRLERVAVILSVAAGLYLASRIIPFLFQ